ncbi:MAG: 23S rRNA (adenine(2030)-N(6))-methyltransferase RlmJ [Gammaproteobacteria bacterium]
MPKVAVAQLHRDTLGHSFEKLLCTELCVTPDDNPLGMNGSGMLLINPPFLIDQQIAATLPWLHAALDTGGGRHSLRWLTTNP